MLKLPRLILKRSLLIDQRKYAAREGSAERQLIVRELSGLRYSYKDPIIEGLDPIEWGVTPSSCPYARSGAASLSLRK